MLRRCRVGAAAKPEIGPGIAVPESQGAQPTLAVLAGRLVLWLWRGPDRPIGLRWVRLRGDEPELGPEEGSAITSMVPVAAVEAARGRTHEIWLATMDPVGRNQARIELRRLGLDSSDRLRTMHREAVSGTFSPRRLTLVWQPERGLDLDGRLYVFGGGVYGIPNQIGPSEQPWAEQIVSMNVGANGRTAGWLHRRYYGNTHPGDFASRSAPGAARSARTSPTSHGCATITPIRMIVSCWDFSPAAPSRPWAISTMRRSSPKSGSATRSHLFWNRPAHLMSI